MKGVILAGGNGTRLRPLTLITNKHLLPVWDKPMIEYPLETLIDMEMDEILIISGREHCGHFMQYLGNGRGDVKFSYKVQDEALGIAHALALAEGFILPGEKFAVILGDNIFENDFSDELEIFIRSKYKATFFSKAMRDPRRFGVVQYKKGDERIPLTIVEKPLTRISNDAVTGLYLYDSDVFSRIRMQKPSKRGELEITDVNNSFLKRREAAIYSLDGFWSDAGTFESLFNATEFAKGRNDTIKTNGK